MVTVKVAGAMELGNSEVFWGPITLEEIKYRFNQPPSKIERRYTIGTSEPCLYNLEDSTSDIHTLSWYGQQIHIENLLDESVIDITSDCNEVMEGSRNESEVIVLSDDSDCKKEDFSDYELPSNFVIKESESPLKYSFSNSSPQLSSAQDSIDFNDTLSEMEEFLRLGQEELERQKRERKLSPVVLTPSISKPKSIPVFKTPDFTKVKSVVGYYINSSCKTPIMRRVKTEMTPTNLSEPHVSLESYKSPQVCGNVVLKEEIPFSIYKPSKRQITNTRKPTIIPESIKKLLPRPINVIKHSYLYYKSSHGEELERLLELDENLSGNEEDMENNLENVSLWEIQEVPY